VSFADASWPGLRHICCWLDTRRQELKSKRKVLSSFQENRGKVARPLRSGPTAVVDRFAIFTLEVSWEGLCIQRSASTISFRNIDAARTCATRAVRYQGDRRDEFAGRLLRRRLYRRRVAAVRGLAVRTETPLAQ